MISLKNGHLLPRNQRMSTLRKTIATTRKSIREDLDKRQLRNITSKLAE
jgi:hypothetical protein